MTALVKELNLEVAGCYDVDTFKHSFQFIKQVSDVAKQTEYGFPMKILDIGGGFSGIEDDGKPSFPQWSKSLTNQQKNYF